MHLILLLCPRAEACACCDAKETVRREVIAQDADGAQLVRQTREFCGDTHYAFEVWPLAAQEPASCLGRTATTIPCDSPGSLRPSPEPPAEASASFPYPSPIGTKAAVAEDTRRGRLYDTEVLDWPECWPGGGSPQPLGVGEEGVLVERLAWSCEATWRRYEVHQPGLESYCVDPGGAKTPCSTAWTTEQGTLSASFPTPMTQTIAGATFTVWSGGGLTATDRLGTLVVVNDAAD
ncbi:MAG TPA: hypothetical protein QGF58_15475 [Myxococcota bacterium]|nr:hypothetical protein [Myxococcota bacterium]